jgi:cell division septal protein FtsQ
MKNLNLRIKMARENKRQQKRHKRKRKVNKLFLSAAAFISAAALVVFCIDYVYYKTDYFDISSIKTKGNSVYDDNYIVEKSGLKTGEKLFEADRQKARENLEKELYVKNARVIYNLPNEIDIEITERKEKYQVLYNEQYIIIDDEGFVLDISGEKKQLLTIESLTDVLYNKGEIIQFAGIDDINSIFDMMYLLNEEYGNETVTRITVAVKNSTVLDTKYGTKIKVNLKDDSKYQITFAMKIINDRLNNNLTVTSGMIDFTKGDSPVYIEDYQMEDK